MGMPDDWANWDDTWQGISDTYGLKHTDVDLSSAEELAMFEAEKITPQKISAMWEKPTAPWRKNRA